MDYQTFIVWNTENDVILQYYTTRSKNVFVSGFLPLHNYLHVFSLCGVLESIGVLGRRASAM